MKKIYSTIYGKEIYPVAISPLEIRCSCVHEMNIRYRKYKHMCNGKYGGFKDISFNENEFKELKI